MNSGIIENVKMNIARGLELFDKIAFERGFEIWRPIEGYPNYSVSSLGKVKNIVTGKTLKPILNKRGYYKINLYNTGKMKITSIHRIVAIAFLHNPESKPCVDHIDNNKANNKVTNLRFATIQQNQFNHTLSIKNKSTIKGVFWYKEKQKWRAQIWIDGKNIHIGFYNTLEEAKTARQLISKKVQGEYQNQCEKS